MSSAGLVSALFQPQRAVPRAGFLPLCNAVFRGTVLRGRSAYGQFDDRTASAGPGTEPCIDRFGRLFVRVAERPAEKEKIT